MNLVLTLDGLLDTFAKYNAAIGPMRVAAYVLGVVAVFLTLRGTKLASRIIAGILAFLWAWTGIGFFLLFFALVYTPAYLFGALFIVQGLLFLAQVFRPRLSFGPTKGPYALIGMLFIAYAMIGYPLVGLLLSHLYPEAPTFGLTPCPLTVYTFGLFLLTNQRVPRLLVVIPLLWALGGVMPISVGILEDIGLILAGIVGTALLWAREREPKAESWGPA